MSRVTCIREILSNLFQVFVVIGLISIQSTHAQLSFEPTPCTRTTDPQTTIEITSIAYAHRFQVTSILVDYPFRRELSDIKSEDFQTLATNYETEVVNALTQYDSTNMYDAVVFLLLPNGGTTQIEAIVSAAETDLRAIDINEAMRRVSARTNVTELRNMATEAVQEEIQYCLQETIFPPNGSLTWTSTPIGSEVNTIELCPQGTQFAGQVSLGIRSCLPTGCVKYDGENSDRRVCHGAWQAYKCNECFNMSVNPILQQLSQMIRDPGANVLLICQQAVNFTNTDEALNNVGIESITDIAEYISNLTPVPQKHLQCATQLIGNVLLLSDNFIAVAEEQLLSASKLRQILQDLMFAVDLVGEQSLSVATPSLALGVRDVDAVRPLDQWYGFGSHMNDGILTNAFIDLDEAEQPNWAGGKDTYIYLLLDQEESLVTRAMYTLHQNDKFYQTSNSAAAIEDDSGIKQLNSRIISVSTQDELLQPTVLAAFKMVDVRGVNTTCVSWVDSDNGVFGQWLPQGCDLYFLTSEEPAEGLTVCECDHVGSFALLANIQEAIPQPPVTRNPPLPIGGFTIFAAILSFLAFTIVALAFLLVSTLRMQRELQILAFLFFDLAVFYLVFGAAINRTTPQNGCVLVAAIMYLCLVSAFAWMAVSAGNSYEYSKQKFIQLKWFVRKAAILAFGIPLGLTIILAVTNPFYFFDTQYICFLSSSPTYIMGAALLLPLAVSILVTVLLFIASFIAFPELDTIESSDLPTLRMQRLAIRKRRLYLSAVLFGIIFINFVLLLLAVYQSSVATHVLFGLLAIAQSIYVVWVYFYYDLEIRRAIIDAIKRTKPRVPEHGKFQPYWSSSKWMQSGEVPGEGLVRNQPARFLDESEPRRANLTPQTFNPDSIPLTALEKKRLKITVNGDAVREAKLVQNEITDDTPVTTGFSNQVILEANGNGFINPGMVIPEPDYDYSESEDEEIHEFVRAQEIELYREDDTAL